MLNIKIFKNTPSNLYVGIYRNGMVSIYKDTMDYFPVVMASLSGWEMTGDFISSSP